METLDEAGLLDKNGKLNDEGFERAGKFAGFQDGRS